MTVNKYLTIAFVVALSLAYFIVPRGEQENAPEQLGGRITEVSPILKASRDNLKQLQDTYFNSTGEYLQKTRDGRLLVGGNEITATTTLPMGEILPWKSANGSGYQLIYRDGNTLYSWAEGTDPVEVSDRTYMRELIFDSAVASST